MNSTFEKMDPEKYCRICYTEAAKYVCPRCGIPYCSTKCYRDVEKHLNCSEDFYRRCVEENLKLQSSSSTFSKEKVDSMNEILERFHKQQKQDSQGQDGVLIDSDSESDSQEPDDESLDSDDDEPLRKRLGDVDLDDSEKVWDLLTEEEKAEFLRMVEKTEAKGDMEAVAEPWFPGRKLIQDVTPSSSSSASKPSKPYADTSASSSTATATSPKSESKLTSKLSSKVSATASEQRHEMPRGQI